MTVETTEKEIVVQYRTILPVYLYVLGVIVVLVGGLVVYGSVHIPGICLVLLGCVLLYFARWHQRNPLLIANSQGIRRRRGLLMREYFYPWSGIRYNWYGIRLDKNIPVLRSAFRKKDWLAIRGFYNQFGVEA